MNEKTTKIEKWIDLIVNKIILFLQDFTKLLSTKKGEYLIKIVFKVFIILLFIWLLKLPFALIEGIGRLILKVLPVPIYQVSRSIWIFLSRFSYLIVAVLMLYYLIKQLIQTNQEQIVEEKKSKSKKKIKIEEDNKKKDEKSSKENNYAEMMFQPFLILIRTLAILITIPIWCFVILLAVVLALLVSFLFQGVYIISLFFIVIGLLMISCSIISLIYYFTFQKGGNR